MLYVVSRRNHPSLTYTAGQAPIVHLEADLHTVVGWANSNRFPGRLPFGTPPSATPSSVVGLAI